jgi:cytochrome c peroxidase
MDANFWRGSKYSGDPTSVLDLVEFPAPKGAWRTPGLRDVALTGPYMHDGLFDTLADVVWHYDQGGTSPLDPYGGGCDPASGASCTEIRPLGLSAQDRSDLVAFLGTLTGLPRPKRLIKPPENGVPDLPADPAPSCPMAASPAPSALIAGGHP